VDRGSLRYLVLAGPYAQNPEGTPAALRRSSVADVVSWARDHGCKLRIAGTTLTVVDLEQHSCR
jgi:hypothetical protein